MGLEGSLGIPNLFQTRERPNPPRHSKHPSTTKYYPSLIFSRNNDHQHSSDHALFVVDVPSVHRNEKGLRPRCSFHGTLALLPSLGQPQIHGARLGVRATRWNLGRTTFFSTTCMNFIGIPSGGTHATRLRGNAGKR